MTDTTSWIGDRDGWASFFAGFERIVLVANSDAVDIAALRQRFGDDALYVFFNKVFKVLSEPFAGSCLLVARSSPAGANIVYRNEVESVLGLLRSPNFRGVLNLRTAPGETFSRAEEFGGARAGFLDLAHYFDDFYPASHVPTSGFALAVWLAENCPTSRVVLAGFTAQRSGQWKLFHDHDWTFEQIVQRLLLRSNKIERIGVPDTSGLEAIARRFPDTTPEELSLVASQVLAERLEGSNMAIDRLFSLTRLQGRVDSLLRSLKPKTRKQKLAARSRTDTAKP